MAAVQRLILRALQEPKPRPRLAYIAPTYGQAKRAAWDYLCDLTKPVQASDPHNTELRVDLINGARISVYGADNAETLRGIYLDDAVMDEYADMRAGVWQTVVRPALSDRGGGALFIGTPKGRNEFYNVYEAATGPDWTRVILRASESGLLPATELLAARAELTPEQYAQEFECSFDAAITGAYYGKELAEADREGRVGEVPHDPAVPVHTAWDLGVGDATAIWFFQVVGPAIHVIDHYEAHGHGLPHYAQVLAARGYKYGTHYLPHDARARDLGTGRTRVEAFKDLTGRMPHILRAGAVMDGINAARMTMARCRFDAMRCRDGLEALRQYRADFDDRLRTFRDTPRHDWSSHSADAFRYLAMAWRDIRPDAKPAEHIWHVRGTPQGIQVNIGALHKRHLERRLREDD